MKEKEGDEKEGGRILHNNWSIYILLAVQAEVDYLHNMLEEEAL